MISVYENVDYYRKIENKKIEISTCMCNKNMNINSRAWTCPNTSKSAVINMSRDNTCSSKIKIGRGRRWKRQHGMCTYASDSTRLLLLVPERKQSPSVGLLVFFPSYVSPPDSRKALQFCSSRTRDATWFMLHVNFASTLDVSDWSRRLVIFYSSTAREMSSFIK